MIPDRQTNFVYFSDLIRIRYEKDWGRIEAILQKHGIQYEFLHGTKDIWCRDYMPVQISETEYVQFQYFSTYIREKKYQDERTIPEEVVELKSFPKRSTQIVLDGGNVVRSKNRVIITDRVYSDNRNWSRPVLIKAIEELLQSDVIIVPAYPKDMTGHADGLVRFYNSDTVLTNSSVDEIEQEWLSKFKRNIVLSGLKTIEVPVFADPNREKEDSAVGIYLNFLEIGNLILLPVFASKDLHTADGLSVSDRDKKVIRQFEELYPDHIIEPVEINRIGRQGGLINCITWNIWKPNL